MDLGIKGRVALVTGGARSLGKADCLALAAEGCKVIVLDLNAEGATATAAEIEGQGGVARGYEVDITDRAQLGRVVQKAQSEVGPVDICVNNAGIIYTLGQLKDMADADWDLNLQVNLTGTYNVTKDVFGACASASGGASSAWPRSRGSWGASARPPTPRERWGSSASPDRWRS